MARLRLKEKPEHFPQEFLIDLSLELMKRMPKKNSDEMKENRDLRDFDVSVGVVDEDGDEDVEME